MQCVNVVCVESSRWHWCVRRRVKWREIKSTGARPLNAASFKLIDRHAVHGVTRLDLTHAGACAVFFYFFFFYNYQNIIILFYFILFYFILFYFILFYFILFYFILLASDVTWTGRGSFCDVIGGRRGFDCDVTRRNLPIIWNEWRHWEGGGRGLACDVIGGRRGFDCDVTWRIWIFFSQNVKWKKKMQISDCYRNKMAFCYWRRRRQVAVGRRWRNLRMLSQWWLRVASTTPMTSSSRLRCDCEQSVRPKWGRRRRPHRSWGRCSVEMTSVAPTTSLVPAPRGRRWSGLRSAGTRRSSRRPSLRLWPSTGRPVK